MRYGYDFLRTKLGGKPEISLGRHLMQNYATFNLVINLESNNKLPHVVIIRVNLVFSERERKEERKGEREEKRNNYSNDTKVKFLNCYKSQEICESPIRVSFLIIYHL